MKLKSKERIGSKVIKKYDKPKTPYHRLLEMEEIEESEKNELKAIYKKLNPFELKKSIEKLQKKLFKIVYLKKKEYALIGKIMNIKYQHCRTISCRFFNEATIPLSYRFLMSQLLFIT
jgi:hypothetical protein